MLRTSPQRRRESTAGSSSAQPLRSRASNPRTSAGSIAEAYGRFLELPVPVVLVVLWLVGAVLFGMVFVAADRGVGWLLAALAILPSQYHPDRVLKPDQRLYSAKCVEGLFSEVRQDELEGMKHKKRAGRLV